ncbi:rRNA maturation RNase YbeY [candidate division KSB1 bacterium]|nr:rRNA maturation RNase YbeY [candidate division KSB1 bacterium]
MNRRIDVIFEARVTVLTKVMIRRQVMCILDGENIRSCVLNIIFVEAEYIRQLNQTYLGKNQTTDVIAFPLEDFDSEMIEGEIYICTEAAKQQAKDFNVSYQNELLRLTVHGVLHLVGYDDLDEQARSNMRNAEDTYLSLCAAS